MTAQPLPRIPPPGEPADEGLSVTSLLNAVHDLGKASPDIQAAVMRLLDARSPDLGRLRLVGRARKVSVSMPEDLTAAVQERVGRGEFSQYVTEAVAKQLELDLLGELATLLEAEHGPVSEDALDEARLLWPDAR